MSAFETSRGEYNLIFGLGKVNPLTANLDNFVLFCLLSEAKIINGCFYSTINYDLIKDDLKISLKDWNKSLNSLKAKGMIQENRNGIKLGIVSNESTLEVDYLSDSSIESNSDELKEIKKEVEDLFNNYLGMADKRGKAIERDELIRNLKVVLNAEFTELTPLVAGRYFNSLQEIFFQRPPRKLSQTDYAKLKHFIGLYDPIDVIKLITNYVLNSLDYHKTAPSIGSLIMVKDSVYAKVFNLHSKEKIRNDAQEVGFA